MESIIVGFSSKSTRNLLLWTKAKAHEPLWASISLLGKWEKSLVPHRVVTEGEDMLMLKGHVYNLAKWSWWWWLKMKVESKFLWRFELTWLQSLNPGQIFKRFESMLQNQLYTFSSLFKYVVLYIIYIVCVCVVCICAWMQAVSNLWWFNLGFFNLTMVQEQCAFSRNLTWNFVFCYFPGLAIHVMTPQHHKIGFVADGFAQLQANGSALSMFHVGWAKLWCLVG